MNEKMKCFNLHGHTYRYELTFVFAYTQEIGYAIDFKEIKRVFMEFIDVYFDHGTVVNPHDEAIIAVCKILKSKYWIMGIANGEYCNPTVENMAKEIFILIMILVVLYQKKQHVGLQLQSIRLWETPSCFTDCVPESISQIEISNIEAAYGKLLQEFVDNKGAINYDDRN
jgi:6-pyruvoyltetrahydropterin/6-carboxytetrahydropterin synthase